MKTVEQQKITTIESNTKYSDCIFSLDGECQSFSNVTFDSCNFADSFFISEAKQSKFTNCDFSSDVGFVLVCLQNLDVHQYILDLGIPFTNLSVAQYHGEELPDWLLNLGNITTLSLSCEYKAAVQSDICKFQNLDSKIDFSNFR